MSTGVADPKSVAGRAFVRSLNMLLKYSRLYGSRHKRSSDQLEVTWTELQQALGGDSALLLGVSGQQLLLDGAPMDNSPALQSLARLMSTAGIASIQILSGVTAEEFLRLMEVFGASRPGELLERLRHEFAGEGARIRVNALRYIATDSDAPVDTLAAQLTARALSDPSASAGPGPGGGGDLSTWMHDPQKLLQLIAAAEGAAAQPGSFYSGGGTGTDDGGGSGSGPGPGTGSGTSSGSAFAAGSGGGEGAALWGSGGNAVLSESDLVNALGWITRLGKRQVESGGLADVSPLQQGLAELPADLSRVLQRALASLDASDNQTPMLVKLAERLAIQFALERYQRGEIKVDAVHEMMERMGKEMKELRRVLAAHEDKMFKAGLSVESYTEMLDRQFWASVPERGKIQVLTSADAWCIPAPNVRSFVEELLQRGEQIRAVQILENYLAGVAGEDAQAQRRAAVGLSQLADLYAANSGLLERALQIVGRQAEKAGGLELRELLAAAFVRLAQEAQNRRQYSGLVKALDSLDEMEREQAALAQELRPRCSVEHRLPQFLQEAVGSPRIPPGLAEVLQRAPHAAAEILARQSSGWSKREEADRGVELLAAAGPAALELLREKLRSGPPGEALACAGLLARADMSFAQQHLPTRLPDFSLLQQHALLHQLSAGAAEQRGELLGALLEHFDRLLVPLAIDEIGLSAGHGATLELMNLAAGYSRTSEMPYLWVKAIEALGRMREPAAEQLLGELLSSRSVLGWRYPREVRIASLQALTRINPEAGARLAPASQIAAEELQLGALDCAAEKSWIRQRRYPRVVPKAEWTATADTGKARQEVMLSSVSLGGGLAVREGRAAAASEALLHLQSGLRPLTAHVILRELKPHELTFEIVDISLRDLSRLRSLLLA